MSSQPPNEQDNPTLLDISYNSPQNFDSSLLVHSIPFSANTDVDLQLPDDFFDGIELPKSPYYAEETNLPQNLENTYDEETNLPQNLENTYDEEPNLPQNWENICVEEPNLPQDSETTYESTTNQMTVEIQPPINIRCRYKSDGIRKIEKSRSKPMTLRLPDLTIYRTNEIDDIWVALSLITTDQNPSKIEFIHANKLEYDDDDAVEVEDGAVLIRLKPEDIEKRTKQLPRISITKKRLEDYDFKLQPYEPVPTSPVAVQTYENQTAKTIVAKAKCFRAIYHLEFSRIGCHILTRKDDGWFPTGIICKTNIMTETQPVPANKRPMFIHRDDEDEEINKKARLTYNPLPTTRV